MEFYSYKDSKYNTNRWINFNFKNNFHARIDAVETIFKAFKLGQATDKITLDIEKGIDAQYLQPIKK